MPCRYAYPKYHFYLRQIFLKNYISTTCFKNTQIIDDFNNISPDPIPERISYGNKLTGSDLINLIRECTMLGYYDYGRQLHSHVLRSGLTPDVFVSAALINLYVKFSLVNDAHKLFDEIPEPGLVSWNSLISGYVRAGKFLKGLSLFLELERSDLRPDSYSFTGVLVACGQLGLLKLGRTIHSRIIKVGVEVSTCVANCLIDTYGKCGSIEDAIRIFDTMYHKDVVSWNSVISASARNRRLEQAFGFLHRMPNPDTISYNEVINGIAQYGKVENAIEVLSIMPNPNSSSWNSILTGYVNRDQSREALDFFIKMHSSGIVMDEFTFSSILSGIARIGALMWGELIHACTINRGWDESVVIGSALIDMYSKCGQVGMAEFLFNSLPDKNIVTWNAMISGYAHNADATKVIRLFERLKTMGKDLKPDRITFLNVLLACWHNKMPLQVANRYFESMVNDYKIDATAEHCSCIIRLMGQEGEVWRAEKMINGLGFGSYGSVWRALLGACAICGDIKVAEVAARKVTELEGEDEYVYVTMSNIYARYGQWGDSSAIRKLMKERRVMKEAGRSWIEIGNVLPPSSIL